MEELQALPMLAKKAGGQHVTETKRRRQRWAFTAGKGFVGGGEINVTRYYRNY